jgi:hypothetical protein
VLAVATAAICAAVAAVFLSSSHGGGRKAPPTVLGQAPYDGIRWRFEARDHTFTSIALTIRDNQFADATLLLRVVRSDASQVPEANNAPSHVVFQQQFSMTPLGSPAPDGTRSTWSGTLSPSDWDGGCQEALYRIEYAVYAAGSSVENPFDLTQHHTEDYGALALFQCSGPAANPADPFPNSFPN